MNLHPADTPVEIITDPFDYYRCKHFRYTEVNERRVYYSRFQTDVDDALKIMEKSINEGRRLDVVSGLQTAIRAGK